MYKSYDSQIALPCSQESSVRWVVFENALYLTGWTLAGALLWPVKVMSWPIATMVWGLFILSVQILLKKHVCSGCYYYGKRCHLGWGRLSAKLFEQDSGTRKTGEILALLCYMVAPALILVSGVVVGIVYPVGFRHWILLGAFVAFNLASGAIRPVSCRKCAMRCVCLGSAAKTSSDNSGGSIT
jgi:hypothetical protein